MKKTTVTRVGAMAFGTLLLASAGAAVATADEVDGGNVNINVEVTDRYPSGVLALTVAADNTSLEEVDTQDPLLREFVGQLPNVTVTDTRTDVPDVPWYVMASASNFVSGANTITPEHLGWSPSLVNDAGDGLVEVGGDVEGVVDSGPGLKDNELLYLNGDQEGTYEQGTWSATADLALKVASTGLASGDYTSVLTLSLFE